MWAGPFSTFPREMGYPQRNGIVYSMKEFLDKINIYNGKCNVFTSLYSFDEIKSTGKPNYDSAKITHLFLDLDNGNAYKNAKKLHDYLDSEELIHVMAFSGGGFHIYIAVEYPNFIENKKAAIFNAVTNISDKVGLKIGIDEHSDIDAHTIGNIAQLVRVPNTYNIKRKRYCIPISRAIFEEGLDAIQEWAQKPNMPFSSFYGRKYFDLIPFDREPDVQYRIPMEISDDSIGIDYLNVEKFVPCILNLLTKRLISHKCRYYIILYCREQGLPLKDTISLLKKYLDPRTFHHCVNEEKQPMFIYKRGDIGFPSCAKLESEGLCVKKCDRR